MIFCKNFGSINNIFSKTNTSELSNIIDLFNKSDLSAKDFSKSLGNVKKSMTEYLGSVKEGETATLPGYINYMKTASMTTKAMGTASKIAAIGVEIFKAACFTIGAVLLDIIATKFISWIDDMIHHSEKVAEAASEARQNISELKEELSSTTETVEESKKRFAELAQGVNQVNGKNISLSTDDYQEFLGLSNKLAELFPSLTKSYDENGNAILDLSGDVDTIVGTLDDLIKHEKDLTNIKIADNLSTVFENSSNNIDKYEKNLSNLKSQSKSISEALNNPNLFNLDTNINRSGKTSSIDFYVKNSDNFDPEVVKKELIESFDNVKSAFSDYTSIQGDEIGETKGYEFHVTMDTSEIDKFINGNDSENAIIKKLKFDQKEIQNQIKKSNSDIQSEYAGLYTNIYSYLQTNWDFSNLAEPLQQSVQMLVKNIDWNSLSDVKSWDDARDYIQNNILSIFDDDNLSTELQQQLSNLITIDPNSMSNEEYISLFNEVKNSIIEYFDENNINIPLNIDYLVNDNNDAKTRLNNSISKNIGSRGEYEYLSNYTKDFTEKQIEDWLSITESVDGAVEKVKAYEESLEDIPEEHVDFFTDNNLSDIDKYKSKINDLSKYLKQIDTENKLSADDMATLNTVYEITGENVDEYKTKIIKLMDEISNSSEVMVALKNAIELCDDEVEKERLQSLYDSLQLIGEEAKQTSDSFEDMSSAISSLQSSAQLLRDIRDSIKDNSIIDSSHLDDIISKYPKLTNEVAKYNAGLIDSKELFKDLQDAYEIDRKNYVIAISEKLKYNEEFYTKVNSSIPDWLRELAETYGIDFNNYKNLCESKLALDKEYAQKKARLDLITIASNASYGEDDIMLNSEEQQEWHKRYNGLKKQYEDAIAMSDGFDTVLSTNLDLDTSWKSYGKDSSSDKKDNDKDKDSKEKINWAEHSLQVLQDSISGLQEELSNTNGLDEQLEKISELNDALTTMKNSYQKAAKTYNDNYNNALGKLSNSKEIKERIESGKYFDIKTYGSKNAQIIQDALDYYNKYTDAKKKIAEYDKQINDDNYLETSKRRQDAYQKQLDTIDELLKDQTLSVDDKNTLLSKQLSLQTQISNELIKQAKYENDTEVISKTKAKKKNDNLQTKLDKIQGKRDDNQNYIDYYTSQLEDKTLSKTERNQINDKLNKVTNKDLYYQLKDRLAKIKKSSYKDILSTLRDKYKDDNKLVDSIFINKHLDEFAPLLNDPEVSKMQQDKINTKYSQAESKYNLNETAYQYTLNRNNNDIENMQNSIAYSNGRGKKEQYEFIKKLQSENEKVLGKQYTEACKMRDVYKDAQDTEAFDYWNNKVHDVDEALSSCRKGIQDTNVSILSLPLNEIDDKLKVISADMKLINHQLDKENNLISAASAIIDNKIDAQNLMKKTVQDQIDALQKEHSLRESNLSVSKAQYELEKIKNQKTTKVFKEGQGWVFESDPDKVQDAQKTYDDALYSNKIAILQNQVDQYDKEVERLNEIKKHWTDISTYAQNLVNINEAISYDSGFMNKVLNNDNDLIGNIYNTYCNLMNKKAENEKQEYKYGLLQDSINDTVEKYKLGLLDYDQAQEQVESSLTAYYPDLLLKYKDEQKAIEVLAQKKLEEAGVTSETAQSNEDKIKESNKNITDSYNTLLGSMSDVFSQMNNMLEDFCAHANDAANKIGDTLSQVQSQLNQIESAKENAQKASNDLVQNMANTITKTVAKNETKTKDNAKDNKLVKGQINHSGMENGYISKNQNNKSSKDAFQVLCLEELKPDEVVSKLQIGEGVITSNQVDTIMKNFATVANTIPNLPLRTAVSNKEVSFNGDIIVQGVQDTDSFAKAICNNLPQQMLQNLFK